MTSTLIIPTFALGHPQTTPSLPFAAAPGPFADLENLAERHRPKTLAAIVGQASVVRQLEAFADAPYPCAFLFEGPTGTGKTTAALALARALGADEFWGVHRIGSGEQDAGAVELALNSLRFAAMGHGSGWKVVIVDEADYMSPKAAQLWLSALEDLPPRSVIVFTTNHGGKFPARFADRCERLAFESGGRTLARDAQELIDGIWAAETGTADDAPRVADLPGLVDRDGKLSFRRAVMAMAPALRRAKGAGGAKPVAPMPPARPIAVPVKPSPRPTAPVPKPVAPRPARPRPPPRASTRGRPARRPRMRTCGAGWTRWPIGTSRRMTNSARRWPNSRRSRRRSGGSWGLAGSGWPGERHGRTARPTRPSAPNNPRMTPRHREDRPCT